MSDANPPWPACRRGEIWTVYLGDPPIRHWVVILSVDRRNLSRHIDSVLVVPFSSRGIEGPSVIRIEAGESGLPGPSWLKCYFINTVRKSQLRERLPRPLSSRRMREVCLAVRRAIDPDAPL